MKRYVKYLLFVIAIFGMNIFSVEAKQMLSKDIEPNSYLIGTHVFTSDTELTMKKIMLAAKTINGNTEDDMIIYYKDPWGEWSDAVTGAGLSLPEKVEVQYIDLEEQTVIPELETPILKEVNYYKIHEDYLDIDVGLDIDNYDYDDPRIVGLELYSSKTTEGTFEKVGEFENDEDGYGLAWVIGFEVPKVTFGKYYKIRTFGVADNKRVYSEFSNVVEIMNINRTNTPWSDSAVNSTSESIVSFKVDVCSNFDIVEVYYSEEVAGEYIKLKDIEIDDEDGCESTIIEVPKDTTYYIKVRSYIEYNGQKIYTEFSYPEALSYSYPILTSQKLEGSSKYKLSVNVEDYEGAYVGSGYTLSFGYSEQKDGDFVSLLVEDDMLVEVPDGICYYVNAYVHGYYSSIVTNTIELGNCLKKPTLTSEFVGKGVDGAQYSLTVSPFYGKVEIYYSEEENGEYIPIMATKKATNRIEVPKDKIYYVIVDSYSMVDEGDVEVQEGFAGTSNIIVLDGSKTVSE